MREIKISTRQFSICLIWTCFSKRIWRVRVSGVFPRSVKAQSIEPLQSNMVPAVCVTGGTGFVATELIKQLLEKVFAR